MTNIVGGFADPYNSLWFSVLPSLTDCRFVKIIKNVMIIIWPKYWIWSSPIKFQLLRLFYQVWSLTSVIYARNLLRDVITALLTKEFALRIMMVLLNGKQRRHRPRNTAFLLLAAYNSLQVSDSIYWLSKTAITHYQLLTCNYLIFTTIPSSTLIG